MRICRENIGYASTCSTSGQAFGAAIGYALFILLESEQFCNKWLRFTEQKGGMVSMKGKLYSTSHIKQIYTCPQVEIIFYIMFNEGKCK